MKKYICECSGCYKTATVKIKNGHRICEDHAKEFRRKRHGKKIAGFWKEIHIGNIGEFKLYTDVLVKM